MNLLLKLGVSIALFYVSTKVADAAIQAYPGDKGLLDMSSSSVVATDLAMAAVGGTTFYFAGKLASKFV